MSNRSRQILDIAIKISQTQARFKLLPIQNAIIEEIGGNSGLAVPNLQKGK